MEWKKVGIEDCLDAMQTGKTPPSKESEYYLPEVEWFNPSDIGKVKDLTESRRKISNKAIDDGKAYLFPANSLLITCIGEIGRVGIIRNPASSNQQITSLKPNRNLDVNFLYYWFLKNNFVLKHMSNNAVVPILNNAQLRRLKIPLPPLPIQKKIAAILDAADEYRQKTKALLEKYDELTQSIFLDMFGDPVRNEKGWEVKKLGECCQIKNGFAFKSKFFTKSGEYALLTPGHYFENGGFKDIGKKQKFYEGELRDEFILKKGDLLVAMTEQAKGLLGSTIFLPDKYSFIHNQRLGLFQNFKSVIPLYIYHFMNNKSIRTTIQSSATGIKVRHTSIKKLMSLIMPLPPINLQSIFKGKIENINFQKEILLTTIFESETLFQSLLQKAFKGELVN